MLLIHFKYTNSIDALFQTFPSVIKRDKLIASAYVAEQERDTDVF